MLDVLHIYVRQLIRLAHKRDVSFRALLLVFVNVDWLVRPKQALVLAYAHQARPLAILQLDILSAVQRRQSLTHLDHLLGDQNDLSVIDRELISRPHILKEFFRIDSDNFRVSDKPSRSDEVNPLPSLLLATRAHTSRGNSGSRRFPTLTMVPRRIRLSGICV